jgi:hypothetical protein
MEVGYVGHERNDEVAALDTPAIEHLPRAGVVAVHEKRHRGAVKDLRQRHDRHAVAEVIRGPHPCRECWRRLELNQLLPARRADLPITAAVMKASGQHIAVMAPPLLPIASRLLAISNGVELAGFDSHRNSDARRRAVHLRAAELTHRHTPILSVRSADQR